MQLFLDSAHVDQIREALAWGVLDGVTTNPTHVAATGREPRALYAEICDLVDGPVSLETIGTDADTIVAEGRDLARIADNVVVKVPVTRDGLSAVRRLTDEGIATNVTVVFSPLQAMLAAKCGATYVSPFVGRLDAVAHEGMDLVRRIRVVLDNYGYETRVLAAALRHPVHVLDSALAGADVATMNLDLLRQLYEHPLTDAGIATFLADWDRVPKA